MTNDATIRVKALFTIYILFYIGPFSTPQQVPNLCGIFVPNAQARKWNEFALYLT